MADKSNGGISKMEAVRQALSDLGKDAYPVKIQQHIKDKFNIAMSTAHISNYKTYLMRKHSKKAKSAAAKSAAQKPAGMHGERHVGSINGKISKISLNDIEAAKLLVGRVGAKSLKALIDLLAE
jgi:hypothetical protein